MSLLLGLSRGIDWFNTQVGKLAYWLTLIMILIGVLNASARYLGAFIGVNLSSNTWLEAQWYLFGAMFMLAGAYALRYDNHVRVDILYGRLSPRGQALVDLLGSVVLLIPFCVLAILLSLDWVAFSWAILETSSNSGGLARYPIKTVVPIAFSLLLLQGFSQAIKAAAVLTGHMDRHLPGHARAGEGRVL